MQEADEPLRKRAKFESEDDVLDYLVEPCLEVAHKLDVVDEIHPEKTLDVESEEIIKVDLPLLDEEMKENLIDEARHFGFWGFMSKYSVFHLESLFQIFSVPIPQDLDQDSLLIALKTVFEAKATKREKRHDINSIDDVVHLLQTCSKILIITGAGCSVSCGIPDFRSKNGIYARLEEFHLEDPQQMFDIHYFRYRPETFYTFAKEIYPSNFEPSPSHRFIKLLEDKGKLLRNYTQNIDTLEQKAGISRVIQCHGSFAKAACIVCGYEVEGTAIEQEIFEQRVPMCPICPEEAEGIIKPSITFFGEKLPIAFDVAFASDKIEADLLIVMGSSLKVSPVADVKEKLPRDIPQILINRESLPHMDGFDVQLLGYCDSIVAYLASRLGWELPGAEPVALESVRPGLYPHHILFEGAVERVESESELETDSSSDESESDTEDEEEESPSDPLHISIDVEVQKQDLINGHVDSIDDLHVQYQDAIDDVHVEDAIQVSIIE